MGYGVTLRSAPRVQVLRGYDPMNPSSLTGTAQPGATILSGQVVSKVWDTDHYEFVLYDGADGAVLTGGVPYIAWSDSTDQDVIESGKMTALSCAGNFEIQTAFFVDDTNNTYNEGTPLTVDDATPGYVRVAASGENVIGYVTQVRGATEHPGLETQSAEYQKLDPANKVWESSVTSPANSKVITFQTAFAGATA